MVLTQVKTIQYKGKPYVEVKERVKAVHEMEVPFEVLESDFQEIGGRFLCKVKIRLNGCIYSGSAEAKVNNAVPNTADVTNPFECAETSAVGRALGFAGVGSVDGIASLDEILRGVPVTSVEQGTNERQPAPRQSTPVARQAPRQPSPATNKPAAIEHVKGMDNIMSTGAIMTYIMKAKPAIGRQSLALADIIPLACPDSITAENTLEMMLKPGGLSDKNRVEIQNYLADLANAAA